MEVERAPQRLDNRLGHRGRRARIRPGGRNRALSAGRRENGLRGSHTRRDHDAPTGKGISFPRTPNLCQKRQPMVPYYPQAEPFSFRASLVPCVDPSRFARWREARQTATVCRPSPSPLQMPSSVERTLLRCAANTRIAYARDSCARRACSAARRRHRTRQDRTSPTATAPCVSEWPISRYRD